jgi:hypothetical protein
MERLEQAFTAIGQVIGNDGRPLVEDRGVDAQSCTSWRETLSKIDEELVVWGRKFRQVYGLAAGSTVAAPDRAADAEGETDDSSSNWGDNDATAAAPTP